MLLRPQKSAFGVLLTQCPKQREDTCAADVCAFWALPYTEGVGLAVNFQVPGRLKRCACRSLLVASPWTLGWLLFRDLTLLDFGVDSGQHLVTVP